MYKFGVKIASLTKSKENKITTGFNEFNVECDSFCRRYAIL